MIGDLEPGDGAAHEAVVGDFFVADCDTDLTAFTVGDVQLDESVLLSNTHLLAGHATKFFTLSRRYVTSGLGLHRNVSGSCTTSTNTLTAFGPRGRQSTNDVGSLHCQRPSATTSSVVDHGDRSLHLFIE